jgi:hypothetical protein
VQATVADLRRFLRQMQPLDDAAAPSCGESSGRRQGQALWVAAHEGARVGLAWDWAEVCDRVVALRDPMTVLSNLDLVDERGELLDESERLVHLNSAIHELDWQAHVAARACGGTVRAQAA